ncbi:MAG: hypothetical protein K2Z81_04080 [Cyanobacteria bacterium]|nr:hypothetical protein [Cyanobacteriota bacterium]
MEYTREGDRASERAEDAKGKELPEAVDKALTELGNLKELGSQIYSADKDDDRQLSKKELEDAKKATKDPEERAALDYAIKNFDKISKNDGKISRADIESHARSVATDALVALAKDGASGLDDAALYKLGQGIPNRKEAQKYVDDLNKKLADAGVKDVTFAIKFDVELPPQRIGGGTDNILYLQQKGKPDVPIAKQAGLRARC